MHTYDLSFGALGLRHKISAEELVSALSPFFSSNRITDVVFPAPVYLDVALRNPLRSKAQFVHDAT